MQLQGKKVLVLGAGLSGVAVAKALKERLADVVVSDQKSAAELALTLEELTRHGIPVILGEQTPALLAGVDVIIISPGMSIYHPLITAARERGIAVMSEVELAYRLSLAPFIAITGTNGKTTTTTLIGEMVKHAGHRVVVAGNIGVPLSAEVGALPPDAFVVAEISSFQLEAVISFKPYISVILNLTPDHIDRHGSMAVYQEMKERIFANQDAGDFTVLNYDDPVVAGMRSRSRARVVFFSRKQELAEGAFLRGEQLMLAWEGREEPICKVSEMGIRGTHNVENALAACAVAGILGIPAPVIAMSLRQFQGVEHRLEYVATVNGVKYYNDSKATNPESAIVALRAFTEPLVLIAGGRDKGTDLSAFMEEVSAHVRELILIGEAADRFARTAEDAGVTSIRRADTFPAAVEMAFRLARPGESVLLSPACASYDMFKNFNERGRVFKELVGRLGRE